MNGKSQICKTYLMHHWTDAALFSRQMWRLQTLQRNYTMAICTRDHRVDMADTVCAIGEAHFSRHLTLYRHFGGDRVPYLVFVRFIYQAHVIRLWFYDTIFRASSISIGLFSHYMGNRKNRQ